MLMLDMQTLMNIHSFLLFFKRDTVVGKILFLSEHNGNYKKCDPDWLLHVQKWLSWNARQATFSEEKL